MSNDWQGEGPTAYDEGRFLAERFCGQPLDALVRTLQGARSKRDRLRKWIIPSKERKYLDGFIETIEEELKRREMDGLDLPEFREGQLPLPPPAPYELPSVDSLPKFDARADAPPPAAPKDEPDFHSVTLPDEPTLPSRPPANPPPAWNVPEFLLTGVPEEEEAGHRRPRPDDRPVTLPREMEGLSSLFAGWTKGLDHLSKAHSERPAPPATPPAPDFPEMLLREIPVAPLPRRDIGPPAPTGSPPREVLPARALNWVEPTAPRVPLRRRFRMAWRWVVDMLHYRPQRYQDWDV